MFNVLSKKWKKKYLVLSLAAVVGTGAFAMPTKAANEYTVLGVGTYAYQDPLSNSDAYKFRDRFASLGWTKTTDWYDKAVYYQDFTKYGNQSDILYFTGHGGSDGTLSLYYSGNPQYDSASNSWANWWKVGGDIKGYTDYENEDAEWMIFAACSAMNNQYWGKQLKNGLHYIFSYHNVSADGTDTSLIDNFVNRTFAKNGYAAETLFSAWINSNRAYSQHNWAIIGHKNNRYDYMHGIKTGATADVSGVDDVYRWKGTYSWWSGAGMTEENISSYLKSTENGIPVTSDEEMKKLSTEFGVKYKIKPEKLDIKLIKQNLLGASTTDINNANKSKVYSSEQGTLEVYTDNAFTFSREVKFDVISKSEQEVIDEVMAFIEKNGGTRSDIVLKNVSTMTEEDSSGKEVPIGHTLTFVQKLDNSYIDGSAGEAIVVGYDKEGINFYKRDVKEITEKVKVNRSFAKKPEKALEQAKELAPSHFKYAGNIDFTKAEIVYFSAPIGVNREELVPAYKVSVDEGAAIYIDALSGEELNSGKMLTKDEKFILPVNETSVEYKEQYEKGLNN